MQPTRATRCFSMFLLLTIVTALIVLAVSVVVQARMLSTQPEVHQVIARSTSHDVGPGSESAWGALRDRCGRETSHATSQATLRDGPQRPQVC